MLVYGDHSEVVDPSERLRRLSSDLDIVRAMPAGIARHGKLVGALLEAGQLLQGVADQGWPADALNAFLYRLAAAFVRSWDTRFAEVGDLPAPDAMELPPNAELRLPEGFAFYGLYPETYVDAARRLQLSGVPRVIGIRSIGTTLGAVVAAALDAPVPLTIRPFGNPFARKSVIPKSLIEEGAHYVIVDEGPGLSGSSFGSVADALEEAGVSIDRIAFLPSHADGPGPQASEKHRRRWRRTQRVPAEFDDTWLRDVFGPLRDIAGRHPFARRAYLAERDGEQIHVKFAGLGSIGQRKLALARVLHSARLVPEPLGFVHGFLAERWRDDAVGLMPDEKPVEAIGRYIGARARMLVAKSSSGATAAQLLRMCRRNISLVLGNDAAEALQCFDAQRLESRVGRVRTDNRLDRDKWLRLRNGHLLKTDALDHHQGHDLIGCQDPAWDVAGAIAEFGLNDDETNRLIASTGCFIDRELLTFYRVAYASFRMGAALLAAKSAEGSEAQLLKRRGHAYASTLQLLLDQLCCCKERPERQLD